MRLQSRAARMRCTLEWLSPAALAILRVARASGDGQVLDSLAMPFDSRAAEPKGLLPLGSGPRALRPPRRLGHVAARIERWAKAPASALRSMAAAVELQGSFPGDGLRRLARRSRAAHPGKRLAVGIDERDPGLKGRSRPAWAR